MQISLLVKDKTLTILSRPSISQTVKPGNLYKGQPINENELTHFSLTTPSELGNNGPVLEVT